MSSILEFHYSLILVFLVYGLAFFSMGLAVVLQWKDDSDLPLTQALPALAAFAFLHGLTEWADMLALTRTEGLRLSASIPLEMVRLGLLASSYTFLLWFGIDLAARPDRRHLKARWIAVLVLLLWGAGTLGLAAHGESRLSGWSPLADTLARYLIGLPAGLIAACGLIRQGRFFHNSSMSHIARDCAWAATAFGLYSVAAGLITPRGDFFPASALNYGSFLNTVGLPVQLFRTILALAMAYFVVRILRAYEEDLRLQLDRADEARLEARGLAMLEERQRLSREVHDGLAQALGCLATMARVAQDQLKEGRTARAREGLQRMEETAHEAYLDAREAIHGLRIGNGGDRGLVVALQDYLDCFRRQSGLEIESIAEEGYWPSLPTATEAQVIRIVQEALSNVRKHARASRARLELRATEDGMEIAVHDDGRGFDAGRCLRCERSGGAQNGCPECDDRHYGLQTMSERARSVGGSLLVRSAPGRGTQVVLSLPLAEGADCPTRREGPAMAGRKTA